MSRAGAPVWRRIAAAAAVVLGLAGLGGAMPAPVQRTLAVDADTSRAYAMGRYYWNLRTVAGIRRSIGYFNEVVKREPRSALGYAGLADAYTELHDYQCDERPCPPIAAAATRYAREAVAREPASAAAHTSLAMTTRLFGHDDALADAEFRRAIGLDPSDALAHEWYGNLLLSRGETRRARLELERAVSLQPVATATYGWLARAAYYDRRFADAIAYAHEALALDPHRVESRVVLGLALEQSGDAVHAVDTFRTLKQLGGEPQDADVLIAGVGARSHDARSIASLQRTVAQDGPNRYAARDLALGLVAAGDYERALAAMRPLRFRTSTDRAFFALDPRLDAVRNDPRFRAWTTM
jgi:serine/threonine-protein kinase